jgi:hypothetical protein
VERFYFSNSTFTVDNLIRFPSPFAKRTNHPCNPNFAKKLVNLSHALAIFQIATGGIRLRLDTFVVTKHLVSLALFSLDAAGNL